MGLGGATATNIIGMVGIGPFLTIPLMLTAMGGPHILWAWVVGAVLSLADGLVYAQLGAALPGSGGPYLYLREAFRPFGLGRPLAFLFLFHILLVAPLSLAGGAVGFADYLGFYLPEMGRLAHDLAATGVCLFVLFLLYRNIESVERLSKAMLALVLATTGWVIAAGVMHGLEWPALAPPATSDTSFWPALGAASVIAMYSFGGYNQVCNIAGEVRQPERTVPRSILLSIGVVAAIYIAMTTAMLSAVPWQEAARSTTLASTFIAGTVADPNSARTAGSVITALILFVAIASVFAFALGYSRMPYAAARDGQFFSVFGRLHPKRGFPHVSLVCLIAASLPFCFFSLGQLVNWLMQVQILLRFTWQCLAVLLLSRYRKDIPQPFRMWLYPIPALFSLALWIALFFTGPPSGAWFSLGFLALGVAAYLVFLRTRRPADGAPTG